MTESTLGLKRSEVRRLVITYLRTWQGWIFVPILALLIIYVSNNVLIQAGGLDAYIYTSYIQNYNDLASRFGLTYYAARIAHLYPAGLVVALFGSHDGYFAYRYLLLCATLAAIWSVAKRNYDEGIAFFSITLASCQPWLLRSLFWDHYDSSGVVYLLLATTFLGGASRENGRRRFFLAGGAYALASNCNAFLIGVGGCLFFSYWAVHYRRRLTEGLRFFAIGVGGAITFYTPLCLLRYAQLPKQGLLFDLEALRFGSSMVRGGAKVWHTNVLVLLQRGWIHLLVPVVVLLVILALATAERQRLIVQFAALNLGLVICLYLVLDIFFQVGVIGFFYYFIYLFPPTFFCLMVLLGDVSRRVPPKVFWPIIVVCSIVGIAGYMLFGALEPAILRMDSRWQAIIVPLAICSPIIIRLAPSASFVLASIVAVASPLPFYKMPAGIYRAIYDDSSALEWDVYRASIELEHIVSGYPPSAGPVGFWYTNRSGSLLNSVQSIYLWGPSRIASLSDSRSGMPNVTKEDLDRISQFRMVCLLGEKPGEVEQGLRALQSAGIRTRPLQRCSYEGHKFRVDYLMLERLDR